MKDWDFWYLTPQVTSIVLTTIIIATIVFCYYRGIKKLSATQAPRGVVLVMEQIFTFIRNEVVSSLGKRWEKLTPYLVTLLMYIGIGNLLSVVGFEPPVSSYTVPLSMGFVMWLGLFVIGIKIQRLAFLNNFTLGLFAIKTRRGKIGWIPNPLSPLEFFSKLISISVRLWGNIFAGGMILLMFYLITGKISAYVPVIGQLNFIGMLFAPFLHLYFDIFAGLIQAYIFTFLTISYWAEMTEVHGEEELPEKEPETYKERLQSIKLKRRK